MAKSVDCAAFLTLAKHGEKCGQRSFRNSGKHDAEFMCQQISKLWQTSQSVHVSAGSLTLAKMATNS
jgi:hypothetical protein